MNLDELKSLVRSEQFGAITLDTSIFDEKNLKLESGLLKQLEQFRDGFTKLIICDVIKEEVLSHLIERTQKAKRTFESSLGEIANFWQTESCEIEKIKKNVFREFEVEEIALKRLHEFMGNTSLEIIESQDYLRIGDLIRKYISGSPPFSKAGKKKYEFPDAIALMSLESWAEKNQTKVIAITKDNDWQNFCKNSSRLFATDDFAGALGLFQLNDADDICLYLSEKYVQGSLKNVEEALLANLKLKIHEYDFETELHFHSDYQAEITKISLNKFELKTLSSPSLIFRPINFGDGLVVEAEVVADVDVECKATLYSQVKKEYIEIERHVLINAITTLEAEVVVAFTGELNRVGANIEVEEVEIYIHPKIYIDQEDIWDISDE